MSHAIVAEGLSKRYTLGAQQSYYTLRDTLASLVRNPFRKRLPAETLWALQGVSFTIEEGEAVGIVGRNGAGKSTLLKLLARITDPTDGWADLNGPVGSLLEVGTGFHPELTGRENIFLNGAILGMRRAEITRRFDEIVAFAEVEKFLDTPVKRYSSGMHTRLAFAVAAHLDPAIMLVDEVLAVGDAAFQRKCLGKMSDVARAGRTVIFVSHNMAAVSQLCTRGLFLREGKLVLDAPMHDVVREYVASAAADARDELVWPERPNEKATITRICLRDASGAKTARVTSPDPFTLEVEYVTRVELSDDHVFVILDRADGVRVCKTSDDDEPELRDAAAAKRPPGRYVRKMRVRGGLLNEGVYQFRVGLGKRRADALDSQYSSFFEVEDTTNYVGGVMGKRDGLILLPLPWTEDRLGD